MNTALWITAPPDVSGGAPWPAHPHPPNPSEQGQLRLLACDKQDRRTGHHKFPSGMTHNDAVIEARRITARAIAIAASIMIAARSTTIDGRVDEPVGLGSRRTCANTDPKLSTISERLADGLTHADAVSAVAGPNIALADLPFADMAPHPESKARGFYRVAAGSHINTRSPT